MSNTKTGGPAFPTGTAFQGMTLRDYFAAKAMQGKIASGSTGFEDIAYYAYKYADAMLKAREQ